MKKTAISVTLMALLLASAATAGAQDPGNSQYDPEAASQLPEGLDPPAPDARYDAGAASQKPADYNPEANTTELSAEMQGMVDQITQQQQGQMLSGDEGSACEAIICLSTGGPPSECASALRKYFSINLSKPWKTIQARINFLKMCPASDDSPQMGSLVEAIGNGAGRCDAASLNQTLRRWTGIDGQYEISNQLPSYCSAYHNHEYTDVQATRVSYVDKFVVRTYTDSEGNLQTEYDGGYWVDGGAATATASNTGNGAVPASKDPAAVGRF